MRIPHGIFDYKIESASTPLGHYDTSTMIPSMTTWTAPAPYEVRANANWDSANDTAGGRYAGYRACDGIYGRANGCWYGGKNILPSWVTIDFSTNGPVYMWKYEMAALGEPVDPSAWIIQGSNDKTNWTDLHSVSGHGIWTGYEAGKETFVIAASPNVPQGPFRYYRVYITATTNQNEPSNATAAICEFNMYRYTPA